MNKIFALLVAVLLSSSALACDRSSVRCGPGYQYQGYEYHNDHRGRSVGRELIEIGIGGAVADAALQVGHAIGAKLAQEISGTPQQQSGRVVYIVPVCDQTPVIMGGLIYADRCDGNGRVVVGRIDRR